MMIVYSLLSVTTTTDRMSVEDFGAASLWPQAFASEEEAVEFCKKYGFQQSEKSKNLFVKTEDKWHYSYRIVKQFISGEQK